MMSAGGKCCGVCCILGGLVVLGAINWGLVGILGVDLVAQVLGPMTTATRTVYTIIGLAGVASIVACFCCPCRKGTCEPKKQ
ncbi:MAG: DUF378 domain-containing protein [Candidatus Omnitrophica bacterium]|nr:DUF378 domain-containing protein [Candidatus Omnitrophota bacterium]